MRNGRLSTLGELVPDSFPLDVFRKVLHPIKPSSEETYEIHYKNFTEFIKHKYGANCCFPLIGVLEFLILWLIRIICQLP